MLLLLLLAEIIWNNLLPLCNRKTPVYDLRNVPGTFAQIIKVPNLFNGPFATVGHVTCFSRTH